MATPILRQAPAEEDAASKVLNFLQELLREYHPRNFAVELWDGTCWDAEPGQFRRFGWKINRAGAVRHVFAALNHLAFAEAFIYGDFDLDGDLEGVFPLVEYLLHKSWSDKQKARSEYSAECVAWGRRFASNAAWSAVAWAAAFAGAGPGGG